MSAKLVVADANADQALDIADVKDGDRVLVQARLATGTEFAADAEALVARKAGRQNQPARPGGASTTASGLNAQWARVGHVWPRLRSADDLQLGIDAENRVRDRDTGRPIAYSGLEHGTVRVHRWPPHTLALVRQT